MKKILHILLILILLISCQSKTDSKERIQKDEKQEKVTTKSEIKSIQKEKQLPKKEHKKDNVKPEKKEDTNATVFKKEVKPRKVEKTKSINKNLPEGIWIAKDFYQSFEQTSSIIESKKAFDSNDPVGLRINYEEVKSGYLNIGYSFLHSHITNPEVSQFAINDKKDTLREQGSFKINLTKVETDGSFLTSEIYPFSSEWKSIFHTTIKQKQ